MKRFKLSALLITIVALSVSACNVSFHSSLSSTYYSSYQEMESSNNSSQEIHSSSSSSVHIHSYTDEVTEPTCLEQGYTTHICECGDTYIDSYVDALGHDFKVSEIIQSTFEEEGKVIYKCSRCDASYFEELGKLEHSYSTEWSFNETSHYHSCIDEGYENLKIDEVEHSFNIEKEEFSTTYTCLECGYTYTEYVMMPKSETRYELVCKTLMPVDNDEIIFNNDRDTIYHLVAVENNWHIVNSEGQRLSVDEEGNLTYDTEYDTWKIATLTSSILISNTLRVNNKVVYLNYSDALFTKVGGSPNRPQMYKKVEVDLIYPTSIRLSGKEQVSLGKKTTLNVEYEPSNANTTNNIIWSSSNEEIVSIDNGEVIANGVGEATITAKILSADTSYRARYVKQSIDIEVIEQLKDSWTIMLYICGADLESDGGYATKDIAEILKVNNQPEDVNVIIETGGARSWKKYNISSSKLSRYHVRDNQLVLDEQLTSASMGKQSTLESFLNWGLQTYPAENTGVIFWNHGGALDGVCFDEKYSNDSLTNYETSKAFENVFNENNIDKLTFVGYDACLMQIQDVAEFNSHYFDYMVGSEEAEAGDGWVYNKWLDDVYADNDIETILKENCDSFVNAYGSDQTLSYLDLTKMNDYYTKFESLSQDIYSTVKSNYSSFKTMLNNVKDFGDINYYYYSYNGIESYGTIDGLDFLNKLANNSLYNMYVDKINEVKDAYMNLVGYSRKGSSAGNSNGLAIIAATYVSYPANQTSFTHWRSLFN